MSDAIAQQMQPQAEEQVPAIVEEVAAAEEVVAEEVEEEVEESPEEGDDDDEDEEDEEEEQEEGGSASSSAAPGEKKVKSKAKKITKKPKVADYGGPKRSETAFFLFANTVRDSTTKDLRAKLGADFKISMVMTEIGKLWKEVAADAKAEFESQSKALRAKFEEDDKAFKKTDAFKQFKKDQGSYNKKREDRSTKKKAKADGMPTKPLTGYMRFAMSVQEEVVAELKKQNPAQEKFPMAERAKVVKVKWDALGAEGQAKVNEEVAAEKLVYAEKLAAWKESDAGKGMQDSLAKTNLKRKNLNQNANKAAKAAKKQKVEASPAEPQAEQSPEEA